MIKVDGLRKWYGSKLAVDNVSFRLGKGEVLAFVGPNGAGKSTTMRVITGFIPASGGSVEIGGNNIETKALAAKSLMGYLPENAPLYDSMTVSGFLNFIAGIRGFKGAEKRRKVGAVIDKCFLHPVRNQSIDTLSKGYRHRTCFAQSILHDPEVLILDEPTDGLDPNQKREVRNLIAEMGKDKAIIISTHILEEVEAVASRMVLIDRGRKAFDGTPDEFKVLSPNAGRITLTYQGAFDKNIVNALAAIDEVRQVETTDKSGAHFTLSVVPAEGADQTRIHAAVLAAAAAQSRDLLEFKVEEGKLSEVFHQLTSGGGPEVAK